MSVITVSQIYFPDLPYPRRDDQIYSYIKYGYRNDVKFDNPYYDKRFSNICHQIKYSLVRADLVQRVGLILLLAAPILLKLWGNHILSFREETYKSLIGKEFIQYQGPGIFRSVYREQDFHRDMRSFYSGLNLTTACCSVISFFSIGVVLSGPGNPYHEKTWYLKKK